jgi:hypothetical protein
MESFTNPSSLIALAVGLLCIGGFIFWQWRKSRRQSGVEKQKVANKAATLVTSEPSLHSLASLKKANNGHNPEVKAEEVKQTVTVVEPPVMVAKAEGKYPAMAFTERGIEFIKIPQKIGNTFYVEPSVPEHHGGHYLIKEDDKGNYLSSEPREIPVLSTDMPQKAYRAIKWEVVNRVFAYHFGLWDKINTLLVWAAMGGCFLVVIFAIDKLG